MTSTWQDHEQIVEQFRRWLDETAREIEQLPRGESDELDAAPADWDSVDSDSDFLDLDSDVDSDLDSDLPLGDSVSIYATGEVPPADAPQPAASDSDQSLPDVGLLEVVESLTAMRHELKLQTKSSRTLESAVEQARAGLDAAMRQFQTVQAREQEAAARASLPLLETLTGLHEALVRGEKAFRAAERQLPQSLAEELRQSLQREFQNAPAWRRWLSGSWLSEAQRQCGEQVAQTGASELGKLLEGYTLIVRRLERDLEAHGVRRIETLGRRVDPQLMTVVELVDDPQLPPETVVEELRPGYLRGDRLIRFAEVRAVAARRSRPDADDFAGQSREQQAGESSQAEQDSFARGYSDH